MSLVERIHDRYVHDRRSAVLAGLLAPLLPEHARVLDVGCGDGRVSRLVASRRTDVTVYGVDVLVRGRTHIPVTRFDGASLPYPDGAFDAVMLVDVLHHAADPVGLLTEAARASRSVVLLKDHTCDGLLASPTLHFMDRVGNARHGVSITADYWPEVRWRETFARLGLTVTNWTQDVPLYPWWASWLFGRSLHFVAKLTR